MIMNKLFFASQLVAAMIAASVFAPTVEAANPLGPKPNCVQGMIAKVENGHWVCRPLTLTAPQNADPTAANVAQKPHCRLGLVAKWENGGWFCKELHLTQDPGNDPTRSQQQKPTCTQGKLPKFENGQWTCKTPDITSKPKTEAGLLLPAVQK
jgi:hypothetical protein